MLEDAGAWHTAELAFCFDNTKRCEQGTGNTPEAQALAKKMATAWANFARTGNPSQPGLTWTPTDPDRCQTMVFDNHCRMVDDPEGEAAQDLAVVVGRDGRRDVFLEGDERKQDARESETDSFAQEWLIPGAKYRVFRRLGAFSCAAVSRFAFELGIAPGIVVERLQHDGHLDRTAGEKARHHIACPAWYRRDYRLVRCNLARSKRLLIRGPATAGRLLQSAPWRDLCLPTDPTDHGPLVSFAAAV